MFAELPGEGSELNELFTRVLELENEVNNQQQVSDLSVGTGRTSLESFAAVNTGLTQLFAVDPLDQEITKVLTPAGEIPAIHTNAIVSHPTDDPLNLYFLEDPQHDGQIKILHPENGKSLNINPGGHFANGSTITVQDGFFTMMLWSTENGNKWLPLQTAAGGGDNLGNHIATQALKMKDNAIFFDTAENQSIIALALANNYVVPVGGAHDFFVNNLVTPKFGITETSIESNVNLVMNSADIQEVDRLRFIQSSGAVDGVANPQIYVDGIGAGDLVINNVDTEAIVHTFSNKIGLQSTEAGLQKQATNLLPRINIYKNAIPATGAVFAEQIYYYDRTTGGKTVGAVISAVAEDTTNTTYAGGLVFQIMQAGSQNLFMRMNDSKNNLIDAFRDVDLNSNDLINPGGGTIDLLTADATPDGANDFVMTFDASVGALKKVLLNNLPGSGSQTPWTSEIDADGNNLVDFGILEFRDKTFTPLGTVTYIAYDAPNLFYNAIATNGHVFRIAGTQELGVSATQVNIFGNQLVLDADADTWIDASNDDIINFHVGGNDGAMLMFFDGGLRWGLTGVNHDLVPSTTALTFELGAVTDDFIINFGTTLQQTVLRHGGIEILANGSTPLIDFQDHSTPNDTDIIASLLFEGRNSGGAAMFEYGAIKLITTDITAGTEDSDLTITLRDGGALIEMLIFDGSQNEIRSTSGADFDLNGGGLENIGSFNINGGAPVVTGSRGGNVALASLLTQLENLGLIVDSTT